MSKRRLHIEIAKPCPVSWASMAGSEQVRFCSVCQKCVYNLSAMPLPRVERLIREREGSICLRLFRRGDGTVMTQDCAFSVERAKRLASRVRAAVVSLGLALAGVGAWSVFGANVRKVLGTDVELGAVAASPEPSHPHHSMGVVRFAQTDDASPAGKERRP